MILDNNNNKLSVEVFRYILNLGRLKVYWKKMENQILTVPIQKKLPILISNNLWWRNQPDQKLWEKISEAKSLGESQTNCEKYNGVKSRIPSTSRFTSLALELLSCYHLPPIICDEEEKWLENGIPQKQEHVGNWPKYWAEYEFYMGLSCPYIKSDPNTDEDEKVTLPKRSAGKS